MFTGIISDIGIVRSVKLENQSDINAGFVAEIETSYAIETIKIGASICCSGACLTVTALASEKNAVTALANNSLVKTIFTALVSKESVIKTNLKNWCESYEINLERSLTPSDEIGGHIVSGHVDGLAEIVAINKVEASKEFIFKVSAELFKFIAAKGSVTLDGVSLTVNAILPNNCFTVNLIPHTIHNTSFKNRKLKDLVNIEIDMLARYVARILRYLPNSTPVDI